MHIQKIGIFYFSGTGNTKIVANLYANEFQNKGFDTNLFPIENILRKKLTLSMSDYDILGFGHPVHAFSGPKIFFDFLDRLPNVDDKITFTFKTAGDPLCRGGSTSLVRKSLSKKGYKVFHENMIVMPANVVLKYDDSLIKQLYDVAAKKVKKGTEEILLGKTNLQKNNLWLKIGTYLFNKAERSGASYFGKYLIVSDLCNLCGKCIKECPTRNISKHNDNVVFGNKCTFCMRCVYNCPERAISNKYMNFFVIKKGYNILNVINDPKIKGNYISHKTKGYFKHFYKYMSNY